MNQTKSILDESPLIPISKLNGWIQDNLGIGVNRSAVYRWLRTGVKGKKLETLMIGGRRYTSLPAIRRFLECPKDQALHEHDSHPKGGSYDRSAAYCDAEGA